MICFVLWIAVIGEKASKYRDDRRYRDLTQATVRSCLIMSSQQDGTWAAVPTNLYHMTTPDPVEPKVFEGMEPSVDRGRGQLGLVLVVDEGINVTPRHLARFLGERREKPAQIPA